MAEPTTEEMLELRPEALDTKRLTFVGLRGDTSRHLSLEAIEAVLAALPTPPRDRGRVDLLLARGPDGERDLPDSVTLTVEGGMPGDRWVNDDKYGPGYQLATTRTDFARIVANGQPLMLHGDNLFLTLDLSDANLPPGSLLRLGEALVRVTPVRHNGCKKWVQRFGLSAMQLNMAPTMRGVHLRGIYLQVVEEGRVQVGDAVEVLERARLEA